MNAIASSWFAANRGKFSPQNQAVIQSKLNDMTDEKATVLSSISLKDPTIMFFIEFFLGTLGVHQFMLGNTGKGILYLFTCGVCFIMWFVDIFTISNQTKQYNFTQVLPYL